MAVTVANLVVKYGADVTDAIRGAEQVKGSMDGVVQQNNMVSRSLGSVGTLAAGAATAGVVAFGAALVSTAVDGTNMAADLETQMSTIAATMGTTREKIGPLKDMIQALGVNPNLKVSTVEAAQAVDMLAKNGVAMTEIMNGAAESTVLLANATGGEFAQSADIMTSVMAQFGDSAGSYMDAVDGIVSVTNASKFSIDDYGLAISQAGGVASSVGVEFNDFNAVIAAISPSFASGSDAGTSYKTMLQTLIPKSKDAAGLMRQLGIITQDGSNRFFDASGNLKSMADVSSILNGALADLTEEQRNQAMSTIFGTDAMRAANELMKAGEIAYTDAATAAKELGVSQEAVNAVIDGGITKFEAMQLQMAKVDALDAAKERTDNTRAALEILSGVVDDVKIRIGDAFLPVVRQLAERLTAFVSENSGAVTAFFEGFARGVGSVVEVIPALIGWIGSMVVLVQPMIAQVVSLYNAFTSFSSALVGTGTNSLVASGALSLFQGPLQTIFSTLSSVSTVLVETFGPAIQRLQESFGGVSAGLAGLSPQFGELGTAFASLSEAVQPMISMMLEGFGMMAQAWGGVVVVAFLFGVNLISSAFQRLPEIVGAIVETLTGLLSGLADVVRSATALVVAVISGDWAGAWVAAQDLVTAFVGTITGLISNLSIIMGAIFTTIYDAVVGTFNDLGIDVEAVVSQMVSSITGYTGQILASFQSLSDWLTGTLIGAFNTFSDFIISLSLPNPFEVISNAISAVDLGVGNLKKTFQAFKDWIANLSVPNPFAGIADSLPSVPTWLGGSGDQPSTNKKSMLPGDTASGRFSGYFAQPAMAGAGNVYITVQANVSDGVDIQTMAYQVADILKRRGR